MNLTKTNTHSNVYDNPRKKSIVFCKLISAALLILLLFTNLTGCSKELEEGIVREFEDNKEGIRQEMNELWDSLLDEINGWTDCFATHSITPDYLLTGKRKKGIDDYVGTYEANYHQFTGEEFIFGGTSLKRKEGNDLKATYSLTVQSGTAALYWLNGDDEIVLANISDKGTFKFTIHAGKNFIALKGGHFTGSLALTVE